MTAQTFLAAVEADLSTWAGDAVHFVEGEASVVWTFVLPLIQTMAPVAWSQAVPIIVQAIEDVGTGNLADLETSVLNKAEALGVSVFKSLDSAVVQAIIAVVQGFHPAVAKPAPPAA